MPSETAPVGVAVVGYGYWGPNIVRNVLERPELRLVGLCERDAQRRGRDHPPPPRRLGRVGVRRDVGRPVRRRGRDRHAAADALRARAAGARLRQARARGEAAGDHASPPARVDLVRAASAPASSLMPGHTFLYSPPVNKVRDLIDDRRARRGLLRHVVADEPRQVPVRRRRLRPRPARPVDPARLARPARSPSVTAHGRSVFQADVPETAFLTFGFAGGARRTSRCRGSRRARFARWSSSAAGGWCSTTTPRPTTASASTTAGSTSSCRRRTSASTT